MDKKNIILTYDYELFLGSDSGDLYKSLIEPTNKILILLKKYNSKGLFFIDTTFLIVIENMECFSTVKQQIQKMIQEGHDIGLHLHPHWRDSLLVDTCRWKFNNYEHFRLDSFSDELLSKVVEENYSLLSSIVSEVNTNYIIDTFRAGGWSIQPFDRLREIFLKIGIKYDFSVLPNISDDDRPRHFYNYKNSPNKSIWRFRDDVLVENKNGEFIEVSNSVFYMNIVDLMKNRRLIKNYIISGDGKGAGKKKSFFEQLKRVKWNVPQIVSSDFLDFDIFKKYIKDYNKNIIIYVAHPKLFSKNSFNILEYICQNFDVIKYEEIKFK